MIVLNSLKFNLLKICLISFVFINNKINSQSVNDNDYDLTLSNYNDYLDNAEINSLADDINVAEEYLSDDNEPDLASIDSAMGYGSKDGKGDDLYESNPITTFVESPTRDPNIDKQSSYSSRSKPISSNVSKPRSQQNSNKRSTINSGSSTLTSVRSGSFTRPSSRSSNVDKLNSEFSKLQMGSRVSSSQRRATASQQQPQIQDRNQKFPGLYKMKVIYGSANNIPGI